MDNVKQNELCQLIDGLTTTKAKICVPELCHTLISTYNNGIKILTMNIRSVNMNLPAFEILLLRLGFECDIIILTECWIENDKPFPKLNNYNSAFTKNCINKNGGIIVYSKGNLELSIEEPDFLQANCLLIKLGLQTVIIAIYRSPSFLNIDLFLQSLDQILTKYERVPNLIIMGDLNIDIHPDNMDRNSPYYLELTASHGLLPSHYIPTRGDRCLDHVMLKSNLGNNTIVINTFVTDHAPVLLNILNKNRDNQNITKGKSFIKLDYDKIANRLRSLNFADILSTGDANVATNLLTNNLIEIMKTNSRIFKVPNSQRTIKPWITLGILRCIRNRDRMHLRLKENPNNELLKLTYSRYRNFCTNLLKKLKNDYFRAELNKNKSNIKKTWNTIRQITHTDKVKINNEDLLKSHANSLESINYVNNYFANVGISLCENLKNTLQAAPNRPRAELPSQVNSIGLLETDEYEVFVLIQGLKNDCAVGLDGIPTRLLKQSAPVLSPIINHICNLCLSTGKFPQIFKTSIITPVHKSGSRDSVNNYRPISILPVISKILEKIINKRLISYLEEYDLLADAQYGFRRGRSTEHAVSTLTNFVVDQLDRKKKVIGIFLDLAKAFDTVSIPMLLNKLERVGIRGKPLSLLEDYLKGRTQKTKIGNLTSVEESIDCGVPQGSVLGPTLFLIYVNELCNLNLKNGKIISYADDTALIFVGDNWEEAKNNAERGLKLVIEWLYTNLLTLNVGKTKFMTFCNTRTRMPNITITAHYNCDSLNCSCPSIDKVHNIKYLGVTIDHRLSWKPHIDTLSSRVRKLIYIFKNIREVADKHTIFNMYNALCRSILSYCNSSWAGASKTHLLPLERAQRAVLKVATSKPIRYPTSELFNDCNVLTVRQLFILDLIMAQHKNTSAQEKLIRSHKRRKDKVFTMPRVNTTLAQRHQRYLCPFLYNKASNYVKDLKSLNCRDAKAQVTKWLKSLNYEDTEKLLV